METSSGPAQEASRPGETSTSKKVLRYLLSAAGILVLAFVVSWCLFAWLGDTGFVHFTTQFLRYVVPALTPFIAAIAIYSTFVSLDQKRDADERNRYYSQLQWALDKVQETTDPVEKARMVEFVTAILKSRAVKEEERHFVENVEKYVKSIDDEITLLLEEQPEDVVPRRNLVSNWVENFLRGRKTYRAIILR